MHALLHGFQKNHFIYKGMVRNLGENSVTTYLPEIFVRSYGDLTDSTDSSCLLHRIDDYDLVVFSPRSFYDENFKKFLKYTGNVTKVFLDIEDDFLLRNIYKSPEIRFYFKRELITRVPRASKTKWYVRHIYGSQILPPVHRKIGLPKNRLLSLPYKIASENDADAKLLPFPLTIDPDPRFAGSGYDDRQLDLFVCLVPKTIRERHHYYDFFRRWTEETGAEMKGVVSKGGLPRDEYLKFLTSSKSSISVRGMGYDTDRYWEIPCYKSALFTPKPPIVIPHDFVDGESVVFVRSPEDLREKFQKYVVKSDEWKEIARMGHDLFIRYHLPEVRIKSLLLDVVSS